jgi:hypothetical protein
VAAPAAEQSDDSAAVIIECAATCDQAVAAVRSAGGQVTHTYRNVKAIAASVPADRVATLAEAAGVGAVGRDYEVPVPASNDTTGPAGEARLATTSLDGVQQAALASEDAEKLAAFAPAAFNLNNTLTGAAPLHAGDVRGQGVIVAVIDSGTANTANVTALAGSIVGGESLVPNDVVASPTSRFNDPHGTRVGTMIAGHGAFVLANTSALVRSLRIHAPQSVIPCTSGALALSCPSTSSVVPLVGTAPAAQIYAVKVADSRGGGVPESRLIAAMDRVITLRRNFNAGMPSVPIAGDGTENNPHVFNSLKIEVVNMSLGGPTLFAGHTVGEQLTLAMLDAGIVVVATAGNSGPAAMTVGNPGTGFGALAVGAMSSYVHERILRDQLFGVGAGVLYRPFGFNQTASFSSRGPTADGRVSPNLVANGMGSFVQTALGNLELASGTSYAAPTVAGAAALLRQHAPWASPVQVRNALLESANPAAIGDGSGSIDRGRGLLDVSAAAALLDSSAGLETVAVGLREDRVVRNVRSVGLQPVTFTEGVFSTRLDGLLPGQVAHFFVPTDADTASVRVHVVDIVPHLPEDQQNVIFGDDLLIQVVDAPTSLARKHVEEFIEGNRTFVISKPQPGLMRIAIAGAFSNAGPVSATLRIERIQRPQSGKTTADDDVRQGQVIPVRVNVPAGTQEVVFDLSWRSDWSRYPAADLDMLVENPLGQTSSVAASCDGPASTPCTLDNPERIVIRSPVPGIWTVRIKGFFVAPADSCDGNDACDAEEPFEMRVFADGRLLREIP